MSDEPTRGEQTRQAVLASAIKRFAFTGYRSTSVADIARDVEVSSAAVYAYFPSKRALFDEAINQDAAELVRDALSDVAAGAFDYDWGRVLARLLSSLPRHPLATRVLAGEEGKTASRLIDLPAVREVREGLTRSLEQDQIDGRIRPDIAPDVIASGIEAILMSVLIAIVQVGGEPDPRRAGGLVAVLDAAVKPPAEATHRRRAKG
jgi:AcrR family transcriptional regulator